MMTMNKTYSELMSLRTFKDRYNYLRLDGVVGKDTFGFRRWLNQVFYTSGEWRSLRRRIILRDNGNDLACNGFEIYGHILVHHIVDITYEDVLKRKPIIFDPDNLITTTLNTHNAIHYGDEGLLITSPKVRTKNDTCPWR